LQLLFELLIAFHYPGHYPGFLFINKITITPCSTISTNVLLDLAKKRNNDIILTSVNTKVPVNNSFTIHIITLRCYVYSEGILRNSIIYNEKRMISILSIIPLFLHYNY